MSLGELIRLRWAEAVAALGLSPTGIRLTWDIGPYHHFENARGYGVTFHNGQPHCHVRMAAKCVPEMQTNPHRIDGVVRHEIGHVLDLCLPSDELDAWAARRGVELPYTPERRADAIAEAVWLAPMFYDTELYVQTTQPGIRPRPPHLGF